MKLRLPNCPRWAVRALQGLSYWIGYRHSLYADHPLPEAAMVVEACNLIFANLPKTDTLVCEQLYRTGGTKGRSVKLGNRAQSHARNFAVPGKRLCSSSLSSAKC